MKRYLNALERLLRDIPRLGGAVLRQLPQETEGYRSAANTMKPTDKSRRDTLNRAVKFAWLLVLIEGVALLAALYMIWTVRMDIVASFRAHTASPPSSVGSTGGS